MNYKKKQENTIVLSSNNEKDNVVIYIYKENIDDEMDEEILFSEAYNKLNENEEFNIVKYVENIWFGVNPNCSTCIYIDFNDEEIDVKNAIKLVDNKRWKLKSGYMYIENNYTKIIITSTKEPTSIFPKNQKWIDLTKNFKIQKLK